MGNKGALGPESPFQVRIRTFATWTLDVAVVCVFLQFTAASAMRAIVTVLVLVALLFAGHVRVRLKEQFDAWLYASHQACAVAVSIAVSLILSASMPEQMIGESLWNPVAENGWVGASLSHLGNAFFILYVHVIASAFLLCVSFLLAALSTAPKRQRVALMIFCFPGLALFVFIIGYTIIEWLHSKSSV